VRAMVDDPSAEGVAVTDSPRANRKLEIMVEHARVCKLLAQASRDLYIYSLLSWVITSLTRSRFA
jgi:hypothetical protein